MQFGNVLHVHNVNEALPLALQMLNKYGVSASSRGMQTLRLPGPFSTVYAFPEERVLFDPIRDANPFFHLIEALWILSGSNTVQLPQHFLSSITRFSDNGKTFHGAYGHRLRNAFGFDQIEAAIRVLRDKPDSRQVVMSIWHPACDLGYNTKDTPCNDMVMLDIVDGKLNMTVCNRSNDAIWGAYGANAVQFSILQEYMAASIGVETGVYVQQSNNFHVYLDNPFWLKFKQGEYEHGHIHNPYSMMVVRPWPLASDKDETRAVMADCVNLNELAERGQQELGYTGFVSPFFQMVVAPAIKAYEAYKRRDFSLALEYVATVSARDWRKAMKEWIIRRQEKAA